MSNPHGYLAGISYRQQDLVKDLEVGKDYTITYDDGTELLGRYIDQKRGFIRFQLRDGSRLVCRSGSVKGIKATCPAP